MTDEFRVGEWLARPSLNRLEREGQGVALPSRFMDLLVFLARSQGRVVSKDEIIESVWQKEFISEGTLTHAVAALRQALGDDPKQPRYIETIPTRGYRLVATVGEPEPSPPGGPAPPARAGRVPPWAIVAAGLMVAGAATVGVLARRSTPSAARPAARDATRLAVLPFENLGTADRDYLASGLTDDLTTRLAAVPGLGVVSRVSAENCAKSGRSAPQIAAELGVSYLLIGSVRWEPDPVHGGQVWVNAQLVRAANDTHVWADAYHRPVDSLFEIETNIASRVLQGVGVALQADARARLGERPTADVDAYEAYLCGMRHLEFESREHLGLAAAMFERAVELDPGFALAYAQLGITHARLYELHHDPRPERLVLAKADIDRALALRGDLPEAAMALGAYYLYGLRDYDKALDALRRATRGLPNDSDLAVLIVDVYRRQGRWDEALAESRRLVRVDPRNYAVALTLGETLTRLREYADADRAFQQAVSLVPDSVRPYLDRFENALRWEGPGERAERLLGELPAPERAAGLYDRFLLSYLRRDFQKAIEVVSNSSAADFSAATLVGPPSLLECLARYAQGDRAGVARSCGEARDALQQPAAGSSADPRVHLALGYAEALLGRRGEALAEADRAIALCPIAADAFDGPAVLGEAARIAALAGDVERALAAVERLLRAPGPLSLSVLQVDPRFDAIRRDARFAGLAAATGRPSS